MIEPVSSASPALAGGFFTMEPPWNPLYYTLCSQKELRNKYLVFEGLQFSSVAQSVQCPTLCNLMNCSMPGLPVHHQLPESTQTYVHQVGDAIQPSHQHTRFPCPSPTPKPAQTHVHQVVDDIQPSHPVVPFSPCLQ